jgi:uncharacterized membrane protein
MTDQAATSGNTAASKSAPISLAPSGLDKAASGMTLALLAMTAAALVRGMGQWGLLPWHVWLHLLGAVTALALTPLLLGRRKGGARHRQLGTIWVVAMTITAASSLFIRIINRGQFSFIHILSLWTLINLPILVVAARRHNLRRHASTARGMAVGALVIAGAFTFMFHRLLARWLFGG